MDLKHEREFTQPSKCSTNWVNQLLQLLEGPLLEEPGARAVALVVGVAAAAGLVDAPGLVPSNPWGSLQSTTGRPTSYGWPATIALFGDDGGASAAGPEPVTQMAAARTRMGSARIGDGDRTVGMLTGTNSRGEV